MVLVCYEHRFIYLKTTKTAGTSAEKALQPLCEEPGLGVLQPGEVRTSRYGIVGARGEVSDRRRPKWHFWRNHPWRNHMPAQEVKENLGRRTFESYTKIANVRDPFDRAVSQFHFRKHTRNLPSEDASTEFKQFRAFILSENWSNDWEIVSVDDKLIINRFIRKEHLLSDLNETYAGFGLAENSFDLPHEKSMSERRKDIPVSDYFDPETIEIVRRKMDWVFEALDYPDHPQN